MPSRRGPRRFGRPSNALVIKGCKRRTNSEAKLLTFAHQPGTSLGLPPCSPSTPAWLSYGHRGRLRSIVFARLRPVSETRRLAALRECDVARLLHGCKVGCTPKFPACTELGGTRRGAQQSVDQCSDWVLGLL